MVDLHLVCAVNITMHVCHYITLNTTRHKCSVISFFEEFRSADQLVTPPSSDPLGSQLIKAGPLWSWCFKPPLVKRVSVGIAEGMEPDDTRTEVFLGYIGNVPPSLLALWAPLHRAESTLTTCFRR